LGLCQSQTVPEFLIAAIVEKYPRFLFQPNQLSYNKATRKIAASFEIIAHLMNEKTPLWEGSFESKHGQHQHQRRQAQLLPRSGQ
jgi:hypothetical protein